MPTSRPSEPDLFSSDLFSRAEPAAPPAPSSLAELNALIAVAPPLTPGADRAVLGEGPLGAQVAFVGEQPGDQEDLQCRPFVGPAGQLFDRALVEAGLERSAMYVTNAVKHFKFVQRGKRRIHEKPNAGDIKHYRWWLMTEIDIVAPRVVVALGATALQALSGKVLPLMKSRGPMRFQNREGFVTMHPSYLLRLPSETEQRDAYAEFVADLKAVRQMIG